MARVGDVLHSAGDSAWCEQHADPHLGSTEARPGSRRRDPVHRHGPLFRVRGRLGCCVRGRHTSDLPCVALGALAASNGRRSIQDREEGPPSKAGLPLLNAPAALSSCTPRPAPPHSAPNGREWPRPLVATTRCPCASFAPSDSRMASSPLAYSV